MKGFERKDDGNVSAEIASSEVTLIQSLASQITELIGQAGAAASDPAVARLLPDAYPSDAEASAEFRRFTAAGLIDRKLRNAATLIETLERARSTGDVMLNNEQVQAWLRALTDIRLTIAARLGIETEDDDAGADIDPMMREIYDWLGFVQNSLVEALSD